jgi:hypothetical protein
LCCFVWAGQMTRGCDKAQSKIKTQIFLRRNDTYDRGSI